MEDSDFLPVFKNMSCVTSRDNLAYKAFLLVVSCFRCVGYLLHFFFPFFGYGYFSRVLSSCHCRKHFLHLHLLLPIWLCLSWSFCEDEEQSVYIITDY